MTNCKSNSATIKGIIPTPQHLLLEFNVSGCRHGNTTLAQCNWITKRFTLCLLLFSRQLVSA